MSASTPYAQSATGASASNYGNSYPVGSSHRHGHGYDGSCYNPWSGGWGGGTGGPEFGGYGSYGNGGYGDVGYSSGYFGYGYGENLGYGFNGFDGLLFFTATWFIFACVFGLFTLLRRARVEYATLCFFSTAQFTAFLIGTVGYGRVMVNIYTVGLSMQMWVAYLFYAKWTNIADVSYSQRLFNFGMLHPAMLVFVTFLGVGLSVLAGFFPGIVAIIHIATSFIIWTLAIISITRHRLLETRFPGQISGISLENPEVANPFVMIVTVIIMASLMLFKSVFLLALFFARKYSNIFFTVFCILPDLFFTFMVGRAEIVDDFEVAQYKPQFEKPYIHPVIDVAEN